MARTARNPDKPPAPPCQYVRQAQTPQKKLEVINYFREHGSMAGTLDKFYGDYTEQKKQSKRKQIYKWAKQRSDIERWCSSVFSAKKLKQRPRGSATTLSPVNELRIVAWINTLRTEGVSVSAQMLELKALEVAQEQGVPRNHFSGSWVWRKLFLQRHGLSFRCRTRKGRITPADMDATALEFIASVLAAKFELGVRRIHNADQTGINFEYLPKQTVSKRGVGTVWVRCGGKDKQRATGMFLADSDGNKYTPILVLKTTPSTVPETREENDTIRHGFGVRVWEEVRELQNQHDVEIHGNSTAWWNADLSIEFLDFHFAGREDPEPILLLWDDFSGHWTEEVENYALQLNVYLLKVPPGLTGVCQPADVSWFRPYKNNMRACWVRFLRQQLQDHAARKDGTAFRLRAPNRRDVVAWIRSAWDDLTPAVIMSGFNMYEHESTEVPEDPTVSYDDVIARLEEHDAIESVVAEDEDVVERGVSDSDCESDVSN